LGDKNTPSIISNEKRTDFHEDSTIEATATGTTIQPHDHGIVKGRMVGFKEPKHDLAVAIAIVHGQQAGVHLPLKLAKGFIAFDLLQARDQEVLR
jgi:hypothetical protein